MHDANDDATPYAFAARIEDPGGGVLVCLGPVDSPCAPCRCLEVEPGAEVFFGRSVAHELGAIGTMTEVPEDPTLSPRHARLGQDQKGAYLVDFDSAHGTWLNGDQLRPHVPVLLSSGDVFRVGALGYLWLSRASLWAGRSGVIEYEYGGLTRDTFEQACRTALLRAQRLAQPLALLLVSGHDGLAARLMSRIGDLLSDECWGVGLGAQMCGRLDRNEFGVLLPEVPPEVALRLLARLRRKIARVFPVPAVNPVRVGLAIVTSDGTPGSFDPGADSLAFGVDGVQLLFAAARADREGAAHPRC